MPVDVTDQHIRVQQRPSSAFEPGAMRDGEDFSTMILDSAKGIQAVIGKLKGETGTTVQSYLFDKSKGWNPAKAKAWADRHRGKYEAKSWRDEKAGFLGDENFIVEFQNASHFMLRELTAEDKIIAKDGAGVALNTPALEHARSLILAGHVRDDAAWAVSTAQMNKLLGKPANWKKYSSWHLGLNTKAEEQRKDRYRFPIGDGRDVYRRALQAAARYAGKYGYTKIQNAASSLLELISQESTEAREISLAAFLSASERTFEEHVELDAEGVPTAFRIVPYGHWNIPKYGDLDVDENSAKTVMAFYKWKGMPKLPIDWEHQTTESLSNGQPAPAIGWWVPQPRADGIWASEVEWSPRAREWMKNKEYRHFSPEGGHNSKTGKLVYIKRIALTNDPATHHQPPLVARAGQKATGGTKMEKLLELLGLTPEATEDEAADKVKALVASEKKAKDEVKAKDTKISELEATIASKDDTDEVKSLKAFKAKALEASDLPEDTTPEKMFSHIAVLKQGAPAADENEKLKARLGELETFKMNAEVSALVARFDTRVTTANRPLVEKMARMAIESGKPEDMKDFEASMKQFPEIMAPGPKPVSSPGTGEPPAGSPEDGLTEGDITLLTARATAEGWAGDKDKMEKEKQRIRSERARLAALKGSR